MAPPPGVKNDNKGRKVPTNTASDFVITLWEALQAKDKGVAWRPRGSDHIFSITDKRAFLRRVISPSGAVKDINVFKRQLYQYGFTFITEGPFKGCHYHADFQPDQKERLCLVQRRPAQPCAPKPPGKQGARAGATSKTAHLSKHMQELKLSAPKLLPSPPPPPPGKAPGGADAFIASPLGTWVSSDTPLVEPLPQERVDTYICRGSSSQATMGPGVGQPSSFQPGVVAQRPPAVGPLASESMLPLLPPPPKLPGLAIRPMTPEESREYVLSLTATAASTGLRRYRPCGYSTSPPLPPPPPPSSPVLSTNEEPSAAAAAAGAAEADSRDPSPLRSQSTEDQAATIFEHLRNDSFTSLAGVVDATVPPLEEHGWLEVPHSDEFAGEAAFYGPSGPTEEATALVEPGRGKVGLRKLKKKLLFTPSPERRSQRIANKRSSAAKPSGGGARRPLALDEPLSPPPRPTTVNVQSAAATTPCRGDGPASFDNGSPCSTWSPFGLNEAFKSCETTIGTGELLPTPNKLVLTPAKDDTFLELPGATRRPRSFAAQCGPLGSAAPCPPSRGRSA